MDDITAAYERLIEKLVAWAQGQPAIRAAIVLGSRARVDHPADEWSDLDVALIVTDPQPYTSNSNWVENFGTPWITFLEPTALGGEQERRVLYEGGLDVDFAVIPVQKFVQLLQSPQVAVVLRRGVRVLLDKDGIADRWPTSSAPPPSSHPPTQHEFSEIVSDFWYHAVWTAKKLHRGELWTAKGCCDSYMKGKLLLPMIEWHARSMHGWGYDTWHNGRFLEKWADPQVLDELHHAFAHYDGPDIRRALWATMDLFRRLARETADRLGYVYPMAADQRATELVRTYLGD